MNLSTHRRSAGYCVFQHFIFLLYGPLCYCTCVAHARCEVSVGFHLGSRMRVMRLLYRLCLNRLVWVGLKEAGRIALLPNVISSLIIWFWRRKRKRTKSSSGEFHFHFFRVRSADPLSFWESMWKTETKKHFQCERGKIRSQTDTHTLIQTDR